MVGAVLHDCFKWIFEVLQFHKSGERSFRWIFAGDAPGIQLPCPATTIWKEPGSFLAVERQVFSVSASVKNLFSRIFGQFYILNICCIAQSHSYRALRLRRQRPVLVFISTMRWISDTYVWPSIIEYVWISHKCWHFNAMKWDKWRNCGLLAKGRKFSSTPVGWRLNEIKW